MFELGNHTHQQRLVGKIIGDNLAKFTTLPPGFLDHDTTDYTKSSYDRLIEARWIYENSNNTALLSTIYINLAIEQYDLGKDDDCLRSIKSWLKIAKGVRSTSKIGLPVS